MKKNYTSENFLFKFTVKKKFQLKELLSECYKTNLNISDFFFYLQYFIPVEYTLRRKYITVNPSDKLNNRKNTGKLSKIKNTHFLCFKQSYFRSVDLEHKKYLYKHVFYVEIHCKNPTKFFGN